ncbi:MAG: HesA/MoeB/ThiF family protein [Clostridia bacterium]|nr:HesA/MoeB/ThiF family protein [Clostridia bacterium]
MKGMSERYARQIRLPEIGVKGQRKLAEASVLVIGAGGLGAPVLQYLTAAGVGSLDIMDGDTISASNLNRQILFGADDLHKNKAISSIQKLKQLNGEVELTAIPEMLSDENADRFVREHSAIVLCTDSITVRRAANRACVTANVPFVDAAVDGFRGTVLTVIPHVTPCYECVHAFSSLKQETVPILGAMAGWVGCAEALAVIRLLLGLNEPSLGTILFFDGAEMTVEPVSIAINPKCDVCGAGLFLD